MEAEEVSILVLSGRGLQRRKKGRAKYSVIFGIGQSKFRTQVVSDPLGNPEWNEECIIPVQGKDKLTLLVTDKDEVLGQVTVLISSLPPESGKRPVAVRLQAHKKAQDPQGELLYQSCVVKYGSCNATVNKPDGQTTKGGGSFKKLKQTLKMSPHKRSKTEGNIVPPSLEEKSNLGRLKKLASKSMLDIASLFISNDEKQLEEENTGLHKTASIPDLSRRNSNPQLLSAVEMEDIDLDSQPHDEPQIISISPTEGSVKGGTKITLEGINLGKNLDDIAELRVCEADCLMNVEYESPSKIFCTTKPWYAREGKVYLVTSSGGYTEAPQSFKFCEVKEIPPKEEEKLNTTDQKQHLYEQRQQKKPRPEKPARKNIKRTSTASLNAMNENHRDPDSINSQTVLTEISKDDLVVKVLSLQQENQALKEENRNMKNYIDRLVARVIIECPQALQLAGSMQ
ncbi:uncharacterized protein LOC106180660 [Lingula anatina]|uniref:Uncharacterized protein LOC106180660 n=1 Tax=Lingula anatina TaxID=7574 RepID=A0A1S3KBZ7_LINAN|nr:uncharacterized protein LOC106180660 [Lingula anatina]|eukprot:XP_013420158.1 uncharacterized protein LOC106180660 [Lingula anatina]